MTRPAPARAFNAAGESDAAGGRLLIVGDLDRLGPIARDLFAPMPIAGVADYLSGIAEIPRVPTRAVIVGVDRDCRRIDSAVAAMRQAAGAARLVFCCEPAYESQGQRAVRAGADDYVIFPPRESELEQALRIPARRTRQRWVNAEPGTPTPTAAELALLADLVAALGSRPPSLLNQMAELVRTALGASHVTVIVEGSIGEARDRAAEAVVGEAVLVEPIVGPEKTLGQIRVGPRSSGAYATSHMEKLRHYGALLGRLLAASERTQRWRELAYRDDLTGLGNRRYLLRFLDDVLARAARERFTATVLIFDIDDFKRYNDTYGHAAGDAIIRETGQLFLRCCRKQDVVCRYGGDEFVVVFWNAEAPRKSGSRHPEDVVVVLNRFRAALAAHQFPRLGPEAQGCLTISGGLASYPWQAGTAADLLLKADEALLRAKAGGKNAFWLVGGGEVCGKKP